MPLNAGFTLFSMTTDIDHTILATGEIISTVVVVVVFFIGLHIISYTAQGYLCMTYQLIAVLLPLAPFILLPVANK
jgi:hypothetical protein